MKKFAVIMIVAVSCVTMKHAATPQPQPTPFFLVNQIGFVTGYVERIEENKNLFDKGNYRIITTKENIPCKLSNRKNKDICFKFEYGDNAEIITNIHGEVFIRRQTDTNKECYSVFPAKLMKIPDFDRQGFAGELYIGRPRNTTPITYEGNCDLSKI